MKVIQIHVIRLEPLQAGVDCFANGGPAQARIVRLLSHFPAYFRGNNHVVPPSFERFSQNAFRKAVIVDIGGIKEVDSGFQAPIDHPDSVCF